MRLIDADNLKEQIKAIHQAVDTTSVNTDYDTGFHSATSQVMGLVDFLPTVEAVPVVRCKDCKHSDLPAALTRKYGKDGTLTCHNRYGSCNNRNVNENDFCSAGELPEQT